MSSSATRNVLDGLLREAMRDPSAHGPNDTFSEPNWDRTETEGSGEDAEPQRRLALSDHPHRRRAAGLGPADEQRTAKLAAESMAVERRLFPADRRVPVRHMGLPTPSAADS